MTKEATKKTNVSSGEITGNQDIPLDDIIADDKFNARKSYDGKDTEKSDSRQSIAQLADSIKRDGLHQPVLVRKGKGGKYSLIYGFRRFLAMKHLRDNATAKEKKEGTYDKIRAQTWEGSDEDAYLVNLTENCSRNDLLSWELADRCTFLSHEFKLTGQQIAQRVGKSKSYVDNLIRVTENVAPEILKEWRKGNEAATTTKLSALASMKPEQQLEAWKGIAADKDAKKGAKGDKDPAPAGTGRKPSDALIVKAINALEEAKKAKKVSDERYKGMLAMYRFMAGKTVGIPGVFSPQKTKVKKPELPDVAEAE